jgi:hypothetical protein
VTIDTQRSIKDNQQCLGNPQEVETVIFPTCGLPPNQRKQIERTFIDVLGTIRPQNRCNIRRA